MAHIKRDLSASLWNRASPKAVLISGARSVGKTTLLDRIVDRTEAIRYTGDHGADIERLSHLSDGDVRTLLFQSDTLVIEEAQRIPFESFTACCRPRSPHRKKQETSSETTSKAAF